MYIMLPGTSLQPFPITAETQESVSTTSRNWLDHNSDEVRGLRRFTFSLKVMEQPRISTTSVSTLNPKAVTNRLEQQRSLDGLMTNHPHQTKVHTPRLSLDTLSPTTGPFTPDKLQNRNSHCEKNRPRRRNIFLSSSRESDVETH